MSATTTSITATITSTPSFAATTSFFGSSASNIAALTAPFLPLTEEMAREAMRLTKETLLKHETHVDKDATVALKDTLDSPTTTTCSVANTSNNGLRLNKFVRRLHDMLQSEKDSGVVEWRRGLLVLHSTAAFAKQILPKYFNTRNFKTFRRQLNYYGFVHVRSFSSTGSSTTALWVNRALAQQESGNDISSVLRLKRVEPCESEKTAEGRRVRKELAIHTVEEDIGVSAKSLQLEQIRSMALCEEWPTNNKRPRVVVSDHSSSASSDEEETTMDSDAANVLLLLSKAP